jgi:hypothetical protein
MSIVDLAKARAYGEIMISGPVDETAGQWILELADEVESLERVLSASRATTQTALSTAVELAAERDAAVAGLAELYERIGEMLREARHLAEHHPDPAAAGAALRILGKDKS